MRASLLVLIVAAACVPARRPEPLSCESIALWLAADYKQRLAVLSGVSSNGDLRQLEMLEAEIRELEAQRSASGCPLPP